MKLRIILSASFLLFFQTRIAAQIADKSDLDTKNGIQVSAYEGIIVGGYVDGGGFSNFTGPNLSLTKGDSKYILSALPSLRYKKDNSSRKNAFVTPNLGIGFTYTYKILAIQIPLFYNSKTADEDGKWHVGIGVGMRLNSLKKSNEEH